jgi:asparagine N-glycosylation enzyme membrane subunit Stt3
MILLPPISAFLLRVPMFVARRKAFSDTVVLVAGGG